MILSPTLEMEVEKCFLDQASLSLIPKEEEPHERRKRVCQVEYVAMELLWCPVKELVHAEETRRNCQPSTGMVTHVF